MKEILTSEICEKLAQLISEQEQFTEGEIKLMGSLAPMLCIVYSPLTRLTVDI
jgi:hypothetical protein